MANNEFLQAYIDRCSNHAKREMVKSAASIIMDTYGGELSENQMDMFINGFICGIWQQFEAPILEQFNTP